MCSNTLTGGSIMPWSKTISGRVTNWAGRKLGYDHIEDLGGKWLKIGDYAKGAKYGKQTPVDPYQDRLNSMLKLPVMNDPSNPVVAPQVKPEAPAKSSPNATNGLTIIKP